MAITSNNVQNIKFLRNGTLYETRDAALVALTGSTSVANSIADGTAILARYGSGNNVKTLVGFKYVSGENNSLTIFDNEGASADVEALRQEINNKLGTGVTSANTASAQLSALSGTSGDASGVTSVWGAKAYADDKIATLDAEVTSNDGTNVQVKVTEVDGKITAVNIATDNTVNSGDVESAITDAISELDYTGVTTGDGVYVTNVTEADGVVAATTATLPTVAAISESGKPITAVSESLGTISASAGTINAAYVTVADTGSVITATNVEDALAEIATEIDNMNKAASAVDGQVVTTVSESAGVVSETKANVKDLQLGGYALDTAATGAIASADTINAALSKLENKSAAITIINGDGSINVSGTTSGTDVNVNIKSGEKVLAKSGNAGLYTDLDLVKITTGLPAEIKERYQFLATDDSQIGVNIDIPKDSHIVSITYITGTTDPHYQNLEYVYIDASGETQTTYVDMSSLVLEAEFASGVTVTDHVAHGVVDSTSEKDSQDTPVAFLTVGADGFKVSGIKDEIDRKINALDATGGTQTIATDKHVAVEVVEANGLITAVTVTESDIASASALTQEISDRGDADTELSNRLGTGVTTASTATDQLAALSGTTADTSGSTSIEGAKRYADAVAAAAVDALDATGGTQTIETGKHVAVEVVEANGLITAVTVTEDNIADADDLGTLSAKTVTKIASSNSSISATSAATADGTVEYDIVTDADKIQMSGFSADSTSSLSGIAESDSIATAFEKTNAVITENERTTASALTDLDERLDVIESGYVETVKVNNVALAETDNAVNVQISGATSAMTASTANAIVVDTDANGNITLGLNYIDAGFYN